MVEKRRASPEDGRRRWQWIASFGVPSSKPIFYCSDWIDALVWKGQLMRWFCAVAVLLVGSVAWAQDTPQPDQLKKMYDTVLGQLRQAQDRKNELAAENDKLNTKFADLQKQLDAAKTKNDESAREAAGFAERTFFLRSQYAAWQEFIHHYPKLETRWKLFLSGDSTRGGESAEAIDTEWPLSSLKENAER